MTADQIREMEEIRLVLPFPSIFYATIYLAESQGFLADVGLRGRIAYAERGGDPVEGLMTGAGEVAVGGIVRLMRLPKDESNAFAIVGQVNAASGFSILRRSSAPFEWTDMQARKFIPFAGSRTPWLFTQAVLSRHGVDPKRVDLIRAADTDEAIRLFLAKEADFIELPEPTTSTLLSSAEVSLCACMADVLGVMPFSVLIVRDALLESGADRLRRFIEAIRRTQRWLYQSPPERVVECLGRLFSDIPPAVMLMAVSTYRDNVVWASDTTIARPAFETMQRMIMGSGEQLREIDFDKVINPNSILSMTRS